MPKTNILFFLIDCLRADVCYGEGRSVQTPALDALIEKGTFFTQAISVAGNTPVCLASLFTGVYPFVHGIRPLSLNRFRLSTPKLNPGCPTLAELLRNSGYQTCATMTGPLLHVTDLHRGFQQYRYRDNDHVYLQDKFGPELKSLLSELNGKEKPWFLFVHLWEIHAPRQVLPRFNSSRYGRNRYERALSSLDHQLREVLAEVDLDSTTVIIHGDHGEGTESLFEFMLHPALHDRVGVKLTRLFYNLFFKWIHQYRSLQSAHGFNVYDYLMRVPLILAGPAIPKGRVVDDQVSQVDIMPTIIEMLQIPTPSSASIQGRSLCPLIAGLPWEERPVYMEAYSGKSVAPRFLSLKGVQAGEFSVPPALVAVRTSEWKCIWVPEDPRIRTELYHLKEDPSERENLFAQRPEMVAQLQSYLARLESDARPEGPSQELSPEEQAALEKRLRELGYL